MRAQALYAWQVNFLQLFLGAVFSMFFSYSSVAMVIIYGTIQAVFTYLTFAKFGAKNSKDILKLFFLGEVLKITLLVFLIFLLSKLIVVNFPILIITMVFLQVTSFFLPSLHRFI